MNFDRLFFGKMDKLMLKFVKGLKYPKQSEKDKVGRFTIGCTNREQHRDMDRHVHDNKLYTHIVALD